ncbi:uncharacterized protein LOC134788070 [Penaeus indicus]|uniref:uncharacterized protein LOC134788070 n=1 Tax=Penaeus indicus TaxID=29960 RepID=UPI00300CC88D
MVALLFVDTGVRYTVVGCGFSFRFLSRGRGREAWATPEPQECSREGDGSEEGSGRTRTRTPLNTSGICTMYSAKTKLYKIATGVSWLRHFDQLQKYSSGEIKMIPLCLNTDT